MVDATTILLVVITILMAVFIWSRRTYVYWQRRRVKFVRPTHILGNLKEVLQLERSFAMQLNDFYFDDGFADEKVVGIYLFHQPALLIKDLNLVRLVLIEDFVSFSNRFAKCDAIHDRMGALNLFYVKNPEWRDIRTKLLSVFSSGKLKQMFALMEEIGHELESYLQRLTHVDDELGGEDGLPLNYDDGVVVQVKAISDLFMTDMIASIAFGMRTNSLHNTQSEIGMHARDMFMLSWRRVFDLCIISFLPKFVPLLRPKLFTTEHANFLRRTILHVIEERERSGVMRNDLIELLLTFKKEADLNQDRTHFTHHLDYLAAQAAVFEIAGIETCSAVLSFALYELARQPALQQRLRDEIERTFSGCMDRLSYDHIAGMTYLSQVVDETLRMYPIVGFVERECTPIGKKRFYSFRPHVECMARRGMPIYISNYAIHHDPQYWPDPDHFDPERFSLENKKSHKPLSYLPYGAGPHNCIGMSIGQLQIKLGLIHFLRDNRVEFCEKTVDSITYDPKFALLSHKGEIYLKINRCRL